MRLLLKATIIVPLLILYIVCALLLALLPAGAKVRRILLTKNVSFFSRLLLRVFNIRVHVKHRERLHEIVHGRLIVANHVSYTDVLIIASLVPSIFITSTELRATLALGTLARLGGCLFVDRRRPAGLKQEINTISRAIGEGYTVVLFPEGTTSNGDHVHAFKKSLFDAAVASRCHILPLCIRYIRVNDQPITRHDRDSIYYYGGTGFFEHLPRLLRLRSIDVEVLPQKTIAVHATDTRKDLASRAHDEISRAYKA